MNRGFILSRGRTVMGARHAQLLLAFIVSAFMLCGCGATKALVKKDESIEPSKKGATLFASLLPRAETKKQETEKPVLKNLYPPIPLDKDGPRVRKFIRHYSEKDRRTTASYMAKASKYLPMAKAMARKYNLPEDVAYLFLLESGADPEARSHSNALGMWQFMPATARLYGLRVDTWVDERLDPYKSTKAAMLYLKDLYDMFGCWRLALSAYNSGENKMNRVLCQEDADEYEQICSSRKLKRETREFWPRFRALAHIAKNPEKFGFMRFEAPSSMPKTETIMVKGGYSLNELARAAGIPNSRLEALNPSLLRGITPPGENTYQLVTPLQCAATLETKLAKIPRITGSRHVTHVVNKGESVWKISRKYGISSAQLASLNPDINLQGALRTGVKLMVPLRKNKNEKLKADNKPQRISMAR